MLHIKVEGAPGADVAPDERRQGSDVGRIMRTIQASYTARRTIRGFEAMLWLRKGFGFAGAWTVREQNRLLSVCFGFPQVHKA